MPDILAPRRSGGQSYSGGGDSAGAAGAIAGSLPWPPVPPDGNTRNCTVVISNRPKMRTTYTALIIPARISEPARVEAVSSDLQTLQSLVVGDIEAVTRGDWRVFLNAEGVIANLPPNLRAAQLMRDCGLDLAGVARGTAVFFGHGGHGEEADVPQHLIRLAEELWDTKLVA